MRTVNHRFLDYSFKLPRTLNSRERDIKEVIRERIARGRIYVTVSVESEAAGRNVAVNEPAMERYLEQLRAFAAAHQVTGDVDINTLAQLPDAVVTDEEEADIRSLWPLVEKALDGAIEQCHQMRTTEGKALEKDLKNRMKLVDKTVAQIEKLAPGVAKRHAETFRKRVEQLAADATVDEDRLTTEVALMADRLDVSEEITRLNSHISQFNKTLEAGGEVSKKLTYLLQEMHREASTIGAKASDSDMVQHVVALKEESEKLREQVQNLE
jgi:uncharacterized protein (TIGR00255 family)